MSQMFRGLLPILALRALREDQLYGYEIARRIRAQTSDAFARSEGSLYPTLHALEMRGALEATWRASDKGPRRRYYRLTSKGRKELVKFEREWSKVRVALEQTEPQVAPGG
jgi:PadR family transcriptional regulator PadR